MRIRNKYTIEIIVFLSYTLFAMAWLGGTENMTEIMAAMQIESLAKGSLLSGAMTLAKIVGAFLAAGIMIKLGIKAAFFASAILVAIGIATPYAPNYEILLVSRFVVGLGGALMIVYFNPIVLKWFKPNERPIVNGINAVAFNVGAVISLWFMADINAALGGWQNSLVAFSLLSIALAILWLFVDYSDETDKTQSENSDEASSAQNYGYKKGLSDAFNWKFSLSYSGILALYLCLLTFSGAAGLSQTKYVMVFGIAGAAAGIFYSLRFPKRIPILRWSGFAVVITTAALFFGTNPLLQNIAGMALGFFIFLPIPALVTLPQELPGMTTQRLTIIFSMFYSSCYMFATLVLWLFGRLVDMNDGNFETAFILLVFLSSSFFLSSFILPETAKVAEAEDAAEAQPEAG